MGSENQTHCCETAPTLSVVVPVFGCYPCLRHLHQRLIASLDGLRADYEIIFVDDRSNDGSWGEIERLVAEDVSVRGVLLSRNFGQHAAITAGLQHARGDWAVVMDCDLQDPPEDVPRLYAKACEGHDIVFGRRQHKPTGPVRRLMGRLYFRGIRVLGGARLDGQYGNFSIVSRKVIEAFLALEDQDRHYVMILTWLGFDATMVNYEPASRYSGRSSYSLPRLMKHALDGVFFQTTVLLRWIVYAGFLLAGAGALLAAYLIGARVAGEVYPGWTSIVVAVLLTGGFIIFSTGITGLYIGKVFEQVRGRPVFVVDRIAERIGIDREAHEHLAVLERHS
jgi:glycosyltransferase involved in cell wall biosynthesis